MNCPQAVTACAPTITVVLVRLITVFNVLPNKLVSNVNLDF